MVVVARESRDVGPIESHIRTLEQAAESHGLVLILTNP